MDGNKATASDLTAAFERLATVGPPERPQPVMRTACVLGGGIAGLLAARVLSDYADQVIVLERDPVVGDERPRAGVPQGRPVHTLLPGGLRSTRWGGPAGPRHLFCDWSSPQGFRYQHGFSTRSGNDRK
jgi:hypothetical protein